MTIADTEQFGYSLSIPLYVRQATDSGSTVDRSFAECLELWNESRNDMRAAYGDLKNMLTELAGDHNGEGEDNTVTKMFKKGQILFGRRRAYLKKAAVAPFDGICSGDITVIEAMPERILSDLLPFIIQNDSLFDYAVGKSAGSLSPRVKWEHLKDYEFELPTLDEQRKLAAVLWAAHEAKEAYKRLLAATDNLVKSQFIEMFGDPVTNPKRWDTATIGEVCKQILGGGTLSKSRPEYFIGSIPWVSPKDMKSQYITDSINHISEEAVENSTTKMIPALSVLMVIRK